TQVKRGLDSWVKVDFTSKPKKLRGEIVNGQTGIGSLMVNGGSLFLDPNRCWVIREYELDAGNVAGTKSGRWSGTMSYANRADGFPILSKLSIKIGDGK